MVDGVKSWYSVVIKLKEIHYGIGGGTIGASMAPQIWTKFI